MKIIIFLLISILLIAFLWFEQKGATREGWEDIQTAVLNTVAPIANKINPIQNPIAPIGVSEAKADEIRNQFRAAFNHPTLVKKSDGTLEYQEPKGMLREARVDDETSFLGTVKFCATAGAKGNPFSDARFAETCGMCMTKGKLITGEEFTKPTGVVIFRDDKKKALDDKKEKGYLFPRAIPSQGAATCEGASVGADAAPALALTAEDYELYKHRAACQASRTVGKGCAICYGKTAYSYVGSTPPVEPLTLHLFGRGTVNVSSRGQPITKAPISLKFNAVTKVEMGRLAEGSQFLIQAVKGETADGPMVVGYFASKLPNGSRFQMPLEALASVDTETGAAPRRVGFYYVADYGARLSILRPAAGKQSMSISASLPFTFVEADQLAAYDCDSAPLMSLEKSAELFSKDPCRSGKPGQYSKECLQEKVLEAGCAITGSAYKNPTTLAGKLGIAEFIDKVARYANMKEIDREAALQCIGEEGRAKLSTPCDSFMGVAGAPAESLEKCLSFLYLNESEGTPAGRAYSSVNGVAYTSLRKGKPAFCTEEGSLNPAKSKELEGVFRSGYKGRRGIDAVKLYLSDIFIRATDDSLPATLEDAKGGRANAIAKCFRSLTAFPENGGMRGIREFKRNYTLTYMTQPVVVLGPLGMGPWGRAWGMNGKTFPDSAAKWIWRIAGAERNEPSWGEFVFSTRIVNDTNQPKTAELHIVLDNVGRALLNGGVIGNTGGYTTFRITIPPGENLLELPSRNQGGPAGLVASVIELPTRKVMTRTDETWRMKV